MTFRSPFPRDAVEYIRMHMDEWPSVLAYKIGVLFGYTCTDRGVRERIKMIKKESITAGTSAPGHACEDPDQRRETQTAHAV